MVDPRGALFRRQAALGSRNIGLPVASQLTVRSLVVVRRLRMGTLVHIDDEVTLDGGSVNVPPECAPCGLCR